MELKVGEINILDVGTVVDCKDGNLWVYIGPRETTVKSIEHHFVRCDNLAWVFDYWTYKAVHRETLERKFPDILNVRADQTGKEKM